MGRRYHILDVFTDVKLAGNPLAVVLDSEGLDGQSMQAIAREFNLSETVFVGPPRDPSNSAAIRIFTPAAELPFAGHPTVGTAVLLAKLKAPELLAREDVGLVLEEAIGPVFCSVRHRRGEAPHARFDVPMLAVRGAEPPVLGVLAAALGLDVTDIGCPRHQPSCFSAGNPMIFVPLVSIEALGRARIAAATALGDKAMLYLYTPVAGTATPTFRSRMLSVGYGVPEDPATGSAAAAFAGVLVAHEGRPDGDHDCFLLQGVEMGRPSRIGLAYSIEAGRLGSAAIGGSAVMIAEGVLAV